MKLWFNPHHYIVLDMMLHACNFSTIEVEENYKFKMIHSDFQAILGYMRPYIKKENKKQVIVWLGMVV